jgi:hypothetical protein
MRKFTWAVLLILSVIFFAACAPTPNEETNEESALSSEEAEEGITETGEVTGQYTREQWDSFVAEMHTNLDSFDQNMTDMRARLDAMGENVPEEWQTQMTELRDMGERLRIRLDEAPNEAETRWPQAEENMRAIWLEIVDKYQQLLDEVERSGN